MQPHRSDFLSSSHCHLFLWVRGGAPINIRHIEAGFEWRPDGPDVITDLKESLWKTRHLTLF